MRVTSITDFFNQPSHQRARHLSQKKGSRRRKDCARHRKRRKTLVLASGPEMEEITVFNLISKSLNELHLSVLDKGLGYGTN